MEVPTENDVRSAIRQIITRNSQLNIRRLVLLFKDTNDQKVIELYEQGIPQDQIEERLERSYRIFDEEIAKRYEIVPLYLEGDPINSTHPKTTVDYLRMLHGFLEIANGQDHIKDPHTKI
jgi:hypothetical protein